MKRRQLPRRIQKMANKVSQRLILLRALPINSDQSAELFVKLMAIGVDSVKDGKSPPVPNLNIGPGVLNKEGEKKFRKILESATRLGVKLGEALQGSLAPTIYTVEFFAIITRVIGKNETEFIHRCWEHPMMGPKMAAEEAKLSKMN